MLDTVFGAVDDGAHWQAGMNFYLNCLRDVDRHIGTVLDALAASGEADRTVVVFTADHGDMVGSHGLRQKGNVVYDENFHVPLIICHPDVEGERETAALASAVDLVPTLLQCAGVDEATIAENYPALHGTSLVAALEGEQVRDGVLTAVETVTTLDSDFWQQFADPDVGQRIQSGELRPDWTKRGFLRGYTDSRYSFGRYFAPLSPNRPSNVDALYADNDVVLYDRDSDPAEVNNLALDPANRELVASLSAKLESLINAEIGTDANAWVTERPRLLAWPTWRGDAAR
jgi:arylsulfatase